jgi:hypothetical protein
LGMTTVRMKVGSNRMRRRKNGTDDVDAQAEETGRLAERQGGARQEQSPRGQGR